MGEVVAIIAIDYESEIMVIPVNKDTVIHDCYSYIKVENVIFSSEFFSSVQQVDEEGLKDMLEIMNFD